MNGSENNSSKNSLAMLRTYVSRKLKQTPLYDLHVANCAKLAPFHGWSMPLQYAQQSPTESAIQTRSTLSVFDVSHMSQIRVSGPDRADFLERLTPSDIIDMPEDSAKLSCFLSDEGTILEDLIITRRKNFYGLVLNAGNHDKDLELLQNALDAFPGEVSVEVLHNQALLAVQGPLSALVMQKMLGLSVNVDYVDFMTCLSAKISGIHVDIFRGGYTGEDGFEVSVNAKDALAVAEAISGAAKSYLSQGSFLWSGLITRDILRTEAGLCLYGKDIDETVTLAEAGLSWLIGKRRRKEGGFVGDEAAVRELLEGSPKRKRVGLRIQGGIPREGCEILKGSEVGKVTSGTFSPSLKCGIAMGYVESSAANERTLGVRIRDKVVEGEVVKMPFLGTKYFRVKQYMGL